MRRLLLIRHAKSDWSGIGIRDFDRGLNQRGQGDAMEMGRRIKAKGMVPTLFIASTAERAAISTRLMTEAMAYPLAGVEWRDELYLATANTMINIIAGTPDDVSSLALLAHNPGMTELAELLAGQYIGNIPTSGVVTLTADIEHWKQVRTVWQLESVDFPKQ